VTALGTERALAPSRAKHAGSDGVRVDIQGLRAVAVASVLVYHLWPHRLQGGYVGVDVFFVVSGFLITAHLLQHPTTSARSLVEFWGRRIRRLLPAATVVLLATLLASLVWLPQSTLPRVARDAAAAALYSENWVLSAASTDYMGSEDAAGPLQHYWSLSVEEQFYVIWPLLIGALFLVSGGVSQRGRRHGTTLTLGLSALFFASLGWSAYLTSTDPLPAYFVTPTRVWELALGGLVALMFSVGAEPAHRRVRLLAAWLGLAMIGYAAVAFSSATSFPGLAALVPTAGTGLVILANSDRLPGSPRALLSNRMSQYLGDLSYSIYLWHWPLIVLAPIALDRAMFWPDKIALVLLTIVLAALTKFWVEDPVRRDPRLISRLRRTFAVGVVCICAVLASSAALGAALHRAAAASADLVADSMRENSVCFGANATRSAACHPAGEKLLTTPIFARDDQTDVQTDTCRAKRPFTARVVCTFGPKDAAKKIALIGNSHAGHWQPALAKAAGQENWQISTYLVNMCYPVDAPIFLGAPEVTKNCQDWTAWAIGAVNDGDFDLVVMSSRTLQPLVGVPKTEQRQQAKEAYARTLKSLTSEGTPVLVIRDVPGMARNVPECVDAHGADVNACTRPASEAIPGDPLADAARADASGLASVVDINRLICPNEVCRSVIGGVIVFMDDAHLTKTFASTLTPEITAAVRERIKGGER
jgi:peptidoglycan/LPS O-acetylase OafA/YrhL